MLSQKKRFHIKFENSFKCFVPKCFIARNISTIAGANFPNNWKENNKAMFVKTKNYPVVTEIWELIDRNKGFNFQCHRYLKS